MDVTQVGGRGPHASLPRRLARVAAGLLALVGLGLLVHALLEGARLEVLLAALGFVAGAALVALLFVTPSGTIVVHHEE